MPSWEGNVEMPPRPTDVLVHVHSTYAIVGVRSPRGFRLASTPASVLRTGMVGATKAYSGAYTGRHRCTDIVAGAVDCESREMTVRGLMSEGSAPGWLSRSGRQVDSAMEGKGGPVVLQLDGCFLSTSIVGALTYRPGGYEA